MEMKEFPSEVLERLLQERAQRLAHLVELKCQLPFPAKEAAMVFQAAIRLWGDQIVKKELRRITLEHNRRLKGLCEMCGKPATRKSEYCHKHETELEALGDKMDQEMLLDSIDGESFKIQ